MNLHDRSIEIILNHQHESGAYPASPNFPTYRYSWFRDGTFIAYAMDLVGEHESANRFYDWAVRTILRYEKTIQQAITHAEAGKKRAPEDVLHTRYDVMGNPGTEDWPNFQLDGFGTLLWGMQQHSILTKIDMPDHWKEARRRTADYLAALWKNPCFDCWEEFSDQVHTSTLAAIIAGLQADEKMYDLDRAAVIEEIVSLINNDCVCEDYFCKFVSSDRVDANLISLTTPYNVIPFDDPRMERTLRKIEDDLNHTGGLQRYVDDTYYGGGEWVLLAAWLGWAYAENGKYDKAREKLEWVKKQANESGELPEQVPSYLNDESFYQPWVDRWGEIAQPLLWSHAMLIILEDALKKET